MAAVKLFQGASASGLKNLSTSNVHLLHLPHHILVKMLSYLCYSETAELREVCQMFNSLCKMKLTDGFKKVDHFHSMINKKVKSQLPRRESERHNHPLARHVNILSAVETRLSLLSMTFTKYIDSDLCCFIPGKVLDELFNILRSLQCVDTKPPRAHEFLQELRDISSMAMEHFDEIIVPILKPIPNCSSSFNNSMGMFQEPDVPLSFGPITSPVHYRPIQSPGADNTVVNRHLQTQNSMIRALKKGITETKNKATEQRRLINEQDKKIVELTSRLERQDAKIADMSQKMLLYDKNFSDIFSVLPRLANTSSDASQSDVMFSSEIKSTSVPVPKSCPRNLRSGKRTRNTVTALSGSRLSGRKKLKRN